MHEGTFFIPPDERKSPRLRPVRDALVLRVLRRHVTLRHDAVRELNSGQVEVF